VLSERAITQQQFIVLAVRLPLHQRDKSMILSSVSVDVHEAILLF